MKIKSFKRVLALALATAMALTACGQKPVSNTSESESSEVSTESESVAETETTVDKDDLPVITMYPKDANLFSGLVTGHRSDYLAENGFQLEVWAYSDDKTTAMLTSGDLPDIFVIGNGGVETLETLIETGKIINYEDYKEQLPHYFEETWTEYRDDNIEIIRDQYSAGTGGLYVLPTQVGLSSSYYNQTGTFDRNVVKLKWDVYEAIGAPEITDVWQLLDVVEDMLAYQPELEDGTKMYGTFLDNGSESSSWGCMELWYTWHGYNPYLHKFLGEVDRVNGTIESIFDDDSVYKEGVKWYNEIYRRGLMDPDSISTSRADQAPKVDNGLAMMPAGTLPGWQTKYYEVFVPGLTVFQDFSTEKMTSVSNCVVVNAETEYLEECLKFVDMLADPYACLRLNYGPEGDIWEADGNVLSITDEFAAWMEEKGNINFFPMSDGTEWATWNGVTAITLGTPIADYVGTNGEEICWIPTSWPDAQAITTNNDNWNSWKETMGAEDLWDYCEKNDITVYQQDAFDGAPWPSPSDDMSLTFSAIKDVVVPATWQMVYAETDEEFEQIWDKMVEDAMALGAEDCLAWLIEVYQPAN